MTETRITVLICSLLTLAGAISIAMAAPTEGKGLWGSTSCSLSSSAVSTGCP